MEGFGIHYFNTNVPLTFMNNYLSESSKSMGKNPYICLALGWCYGLNAEHSTISYVFEHLIPSWQYFVGPSGDGVSLEEVDYLLGLSLEAL